MVFVAACPSGRGEASGTEAGRLEVEPADDRERQILRRLGVGSPSRKAQGVGGRSESSTPRQSHAGEAPAVKKPRYPGPGKGREPPAGTEKPTRRGDATVGRKPAGGRTSGE
jgi:hypothetical protein